MAQTKTKSKFTKEWIIDNAIEICSEYDAGVLTLRALHYQLVSIGMTNDLSHYKKVVNAMIEARWNGQIEFATFSDLDREMVGETEYEETILDDEIESAKSTIRYWLNNYYKNKWENQPYYIEVFIEKKALQGVFTTPCERWNVALGACKGYPSLTFLNESCNRFKKAIEAGKKVCILYFGDYDASGEDIPRSIQENFNKFGVDAEIKIIALNKSQVIAWNLPPAPTKETDTRAAKWDGLGQVELDAVKPNKLIDLCNDAIEQMFDFDLYEQLRETEAQEKEIYKANLKEFITNL